VVRFGTLRRAAVACFVITLAVFPASAAAATGSAAPPSSVDAVPIFVPIISAGFDHSCVIGQADGTLTCWGSSSDGATDVPAGTYKAVSAGNGVTCAIKSDDTLACWGWDGYGLVSDVPAGTFTAVSAGGWHACAIRTDGTLACWGFDDDGQVSDAPSGTYTAVEAGGWHNCAIATGGTLACWGYNEDGRASPPAGTYTAVTAGQWHSCAVSSSDQSVACWGWDGDGQASPPAGTYSGVSAGTYHTCGIKTNGTLACWGWNGDGQTSAPAGTYAGVSAGWWHNCAVEADGTPACWGWNYYNQATTAEPAATTYVPVEPARLLDSRHNVGVSGVFKANVAQTFNVAGTLTIPANAVAVTGNLTVTGSTGRGYAAVTPIATNTPTTSTLNLPLGDTRANNVTVALNPSGGSLGAVFVGPAGTTAHLIFDVTGYFVADDTSATYNAVDPIRLLDTRSGNGLPSKLVSRVPKLVQIATRGGIPADATAITANVTVVNQTTKGYVALSPVATSTPSTSTMNFPLGDTRANGLTVKLDGDGKLGIVYVSTSASATADAILDVTGYYLEDLTGAHFYPLTPDRLLDTRNQIGLDGKLTAYNPEELVTAARVGIPADAMAVSGNLTVVSQSKKGYVAMTRTPTATPSTSTINFPVGDTRANGVTGPLGNPGTVGLVYAAPAGATTHLILDITGYFKLAVASPGATSSPATPSLSHSRPTSERDGAISPDNPRAPG